MDLHLINGFLGAGKTTAIITAARYLVQQNKKVGIITNDKGRFQVDAAFFQSSMIPTRQVAGGCFRCSFSEFEEEISQLQMQNTPDVIFAESVGSCVDLVNTVFSPIMKNSKIRVGRMTYSVFTDIRLYKHWINREPLPFSDEINYLFAKQVEEGNLLLLNKSDTLTSSEKEEILSKTIKIFPQKTILMQNSKNQEDVIIWLNALEKQAANIPQPDFAVDYTLYKKGENDLSWLDHKLLIESPTPEKIKPVLIEMISLLLNEIQRKGIAVGNIKIFLSYPEQGTKLSFTTTDILEKNTLPNWKELLPEIKVNAVTVMLNARVYVQADEFKTIFKKAVDKASSFPQVRIQSEKGTSYNPLMSMDHPH